MIYDEEFNLNEYRLYTVCPNTPNPVYLTCSSPVSEANLPRTPEPHTPETGMPDKMSGIRGILDFSTYMYFTT